MGAKAAAQVAAAVTVGVPTNQVRVAAVVAYCPALEAKLDTEMFASETEVVEAVLAGAQVPTEARQTKVHRPGVVAAAGVPTVVEHRGMAAAQAERP